MPTITVGETAAVLGSSQAGPVAWDMVYNDTYTCTTVGVPYAEFYPTPYVAASMQIENLGANQYVIEFIGGPNYWAQSGSPVSSEQLYAGVYIVVNDGAGSTADVLVILYPIPNPPPAPSTKVAPPTARQSLSRMPRTQTGLLSYAQGIFAQVGGAALDAANIVFAAALETARSPSTRTPVTVNAAKVAETNVRLELRNTLLPLAQGLGVPSRIRMLEPVGIKGLKIKNNMLQFDRPTGGPAREGRSGLEVQVRIKGTPEIIQVGTSTKFPVTIDLFDEIIGETVEIRCAWVWYEGPVKQRGPWSAWTEFSL
jgi:hypothetical protein